MFTLRKMKITLKNTQGVYRNAHSPLFLITRSDRDSTKQDLHLIMSSFLLSENIFNPERGLTVIKTGTNLT